MAERVDAEREFGYVSSGSNVSFWTAVSSELIEEISAFTAA